MLIGLLGQAKSGKDTIATYLKENHGFHQLAFADKLKSVTKDLFGLSISQVYSQEGKMEMIFRYGKTPRTLLQEVGTALRNVHPSIWIDYVISEYVTRYLTTNRHVVISDVRYINEVEAIKRADGKVVRVVREDYQGLQGAEAQHASETEQLKIPDSDFDLVIRAKTGEINKLYDGIEAIL